MNAGRFTPLVVKQLLRNRRRSILTFLGLVMSFFLFTSLESVLHTLRSILERTGSEATVFTRPRYGVAFWTAAIPESYLPRIRATKGVRASTPYLFFVGAGKKEGEFTLALGVDPYSVRDVRTMEGVTDAEFAEFRGRRTAAIVGERAAAQNGWKVGDRITVRGAAGTVPISVDFDVVALADAEGNFGRVVAGHLGYLQERTGQEGRVTFIVSALENPENSGPVIETLDETFRNYTVPTETISEKSHLQTVLGGLGDMLFALQAISYLALGVTVLVVANTIAMGVRERTVELGTMRALGFSPRLVSTLVLSEAVLLSALGAVAGSATAWALFHYGIIRMPEQVDFPLRTDVRLVWKSALLSVPVGLLAAAQPAWQTAKMTITDALRFAD
ncbi:MAG: ABC transporter permease [Chrysiogenetes bacterium]|nr:ABC transporter permease [Chrysiogenetes bacterium]